MSHVLSGKRVAILVANGFSQDEMVACQKTMLEYGANTRTVSSENGVVNGWEGNAWGHHFAVDVQINTALSADYDVLIIPGGMRSLDKLALTEHTRRFVSGFVNMVKPVICFNEGVKALAYTNTCENVEIACPDDLMQTMTAQGADCMTEKACRDGCILTYLCDKEELKDCVAKMMADLTAVCEEDQQDLKKVA